MSELEIERGDVTLVMNTQGPRKGPTLLFLHGGGESRAVWSPVFSRLRPRHWQLVAPDLRGHGDSGCSQAYVFDDFVRDGYEIMRHLKGRPLVLVGSSIGGLMALMLTLRYPMMIDGLVLLDAPTRLSRAAAKRESEKILASLTGTKHEPDPLDSQHALGQLLDDILANPDRLAEAAQSVCVPTLFLHGCENDAVGQEELNGLKKDIPHVETAAIEAGHHMARENPQAVADQISEFVPGLIREVVH
ncbi:alpha/beta fold hydrolase [Gilvimarinus sp. F26214L]|uniref:alpha/beta fold hydrolase n=1 Tax=Gilvimarinus sp. DZF01 TaxID=3461371 RepID=UPI0040464F12